MPLYCVEAGSVYGIYEAGSPAEASAALAKDLGKRLSRTGWTVRLVARVEREEGGATRYVLEDGAVRIDTGLRYRPRRRPPKKPDPD